MLTNKRLKPEQLVELIYMSKDGEITQRIVKINGENKDNIFGFCYLRKNYRSFKKEQILAIQPRRKRKRKF